MGCLVLVVMVHRTSDGRMYVNFGLQGSGYQIYLHLSHHAHRVAGAKMAAARERFEFSLRSASNDHYIEQNDSSSPILPTVSNVRCEIGNMSDDYSCTVYALQFQDSLQRGWLKYSNRVQHALAHRHSVGSCARVGTHFKGHSTSRHRVSSIHAARMAAYLWWQVTIVCAAVLDCSHLLLVAGGNLPPQLLHVQCSVGWPHNAVHCLVRYSVLLLW